MLSKTLREICLFSRGWSLLRSGNENIRWIKENKCGLLTLRN